MSFNQTETAAGNDSPRQMLCRGLSTGIADLLAAVRQPQIMANIVSVIFNAAYDNHPAVVCFFIGSNGLSGSSPLGLGGWHLQ